MQMIEMVPKLRFKDESGQEFPEWKYLPLGKMTNIKSSKRVLKEDWKNEGIPFYRTREIISLSNKESFSTPTFIDEKLYKELKINYGVPTVNDVLVTGVGTIGITYIVEDNKPFYFKDGNVILVESSNSLDSQFIKYCYQTRHVKKQLSDNASITTVATYTIDNARKTIIPVPLITEQQKIASFLSSVDKKISQLKKKKTLLETYKRGIMQKIFSQELRFKDENGQEFSEIIKSKLDAHLISVSSGKSTTKSKRGIYPIYGSTGKISSSEKYEYEGENILIARVGANAGSIYLVNGKYNVTDNTLILSLKKDIDLHYIYFWLTNFNLTRLIFGSGQPLITGKIIKSLMFDFPQIREQQKIASFLFSIDKKIEITSTQLEKTREFKKGLLQQMFV